jgi:hypothetical protein
VIEWSCGLVELGRDVVNLCSGLLSLIGWHSLACGLLATEREYSLLSRFASGKVPATRRAHSLAAAGLLWYEQQANDHRNRDT